MNPVVQLFAVRQIKILISIGAAKQRILRRQVRPVDKDDVYLVADRLVKHLEILNRNFHLAGKNLFNIIPSCHRADIPFFDVSNPLRVLEARRRDVGYIAHRSAWKAHRNRQVGIVEQLVGMAFMECQFFIG